MDWLEEATAKVYCWSQLKKLQEQVLHLVTFQSASYIEHIQCSLVYEPVILPWCSSLEVLDN